MGASAEEFGPYVVYEQIGLGGMATVHRAETQGIAGFSKTVALKRMLPSVASDASLVKSFIREARLASQLRHANVAQTYDLGKVGDTYFIAMELVQGRNLREILKHCASVVGHMPMPIAMNIVNQICDALDYAHNLCDDSGQPLGIIHRDVSPSNIIVGEGGIVKLIDFGIAKATARGMNTMSGTIKGKFGYMAPEYLMGSIDARADLFALGVIAHELLSNRPLFQGRDDMDTLYRVKDMPILPPSRFNPKVPPEIDSIIMTALDRDPDQRWQRATALRTALTTETKRLKLDVMNTQVTDWLERAFAQKKGGSSKNRSDFDVDSEPVISISGGTTELPRGSAPGVEREVPDDFLAADSMATMVKPSGSKPYQAQPAPSRKADVPTLKRDEVPRDQWVVATEVTIQAADAHPGDADWKMGSDVPTRLVRPSAQLKAQAHDPELYDTKRDREEPLLDTKRDRSGPVPKQRIDRPSSPHVIQRKTPQPQAAQRPPLPSPDDVGTLRPGRIDGKELKEIARQHLQQQQQLDEDEIRTLPPRAQTEVAPDFDNMRTLPPELDLDNMRTLPPVGVPPGDLRRTIPERPRTDRPNRPNPPSIAPDRSADALPPPPVVAASPEQKTLFDPGQGYAPSIVQSGARTAPHMPAAAVREAATSLDDLSARAIRPSAGALGTLPLQPSPAPVAAPRPVHPAMPQTEARTRVAPPKNSGAGNFLLVLLVLVAAGGAAAVVYFALPYLT